MGFWVYVVPFLMLFATVIAYAQSYSAVLVLDPISPQVREGDTIIFSGKLMISDGQYVIPNKSVYIKDDVDFGADTVLGIVTTDQNGRFSATWTAQQRSSDAWNFYAVFEGDSQVSKARSTTYSVYVNPSSSGSTSGSGSYYDGSSNSGSNSYGGRSSKYYQTQLSLDPLPSQVYVNDVVRFTGQLTTNGSPVQGALIYIKEDDPLSPDEYLGNSRTDSNGQFSISWKVKAGYVEKDFDIYAAFEGADNFKKSRSTNQIVSVLKYDGGITLDRFPSSANIGDIVTFSGTLNLGMDSPEGAIVYIKDEDPLSGDDLLATAYVNGNGRFSANWFVTDVDADSVADVYAVFEGNDKYYRLTTCDNGPTSSFGGTCYNTIPLTIHYTETPTPPIQNPDTSSKEYIDLYYAMDFTKNPKVAIVPDPDAYAETSRGIVPAEEGILMWKSYLDSKYGGNWNVDFDIVSQDDLFFTSKPDVIVNLVTPERQTRCNSDIFGITYVPRSPVKPVQAQVCTSANGNNYPSEIISATSAHEFIHAIGLGHTWNKKGDLMCSVEEINGQQISTCPPSYSKSTTPSDLNLAGMVKLYGNDGFKNPNYKVSYKTKYSPTQSVSDNTSDEPIKKKTPTEKTKTKVKSDSSKNTKQSKAKKSIKPTTNKSYGLVVIKPTDLNKELLDQFKKLKK